jgi:hypothetical protein
MKDHNNIDLRINALTLRKYNTFINTTAIESTFKITEIDGDKVSSVVVTKDGNCLIDGTHITFDTSYGMLYEWFTNGCLPDSEGVSIVFDEEFVFRGLDTEEFGFSMGSYFIGAPNVRQLISPVQFAQHLAIWIYRCDRNVSK